MKPIKVAKVRVEDGPPARILLLPVDIWGSPDQPNRRLWGQAPLRITQVAALRRGDKAKAESKISIVKVRDIVHSKKFR